MTWTLTSGATVITPTLVLEYEAEAESNNIIHAVLGAASPAVTLRDDTLRAGTLVLMFSTSTAAWAAYNLHKTAHTFTLASTDTPAANMTYVRTGSMVISLDETLSVWLLNIQFQEVA